MDGQVGKDPSLKVERAGSKRQILNVWLDDADVSPGSGYAALSRSSMRASVPAIASMRGLIESALR